MTPNELLTLAKEITTVRVTVDQVIFNGEGYVIDVVIASNGDGEADADLYDGTDGSGTKKYDLYCADEEMDQLCFDPPLCLVKGCYVDIGTNCESVTVRYLQR